MGMGHVTSMEAEEGAASGNQISPTCSFFLYSHDMCI